MMKKKESRNHWICLGVLIIIAGITLPMGYLSIALYVVGGILSGYHLVMKAKENFNE